MAITKIHAINRSTKDAIKYISDPLKTRDGELVEGVHCAPPFAAFEFEMLAHMSHEYNGNYERVGGRHVGGQRLHQAAKSYHLIQSFRQTITSLRRRLTRSVYNSCANCLATITSLSLRPILTKIIFTITSSLTHTR